jgi:hypothetical protein
LLLRDCQEKIQIALFERRRLANFLIFILTGSRPVKTLLKRAADVKKNYFEQITNGVFSFALFPRGKRGDLNFKNDWQKEKVNYGQRDY